MEKFSDPVDEGQWLAQQHVNLALAAHAIKARPDQVKALNEDGVMEWPTKECRVCGEDLEPARLETGYTICVDCREIQERQDASRR